MAFLSKESRWITTRDTQYYLVSMVLPHESNEKPNSSASQAQKLLESVSVAAQTEKVLVSNFNHAIQDQIKLANCNQNKMARTARYLVGKVRAIVVP